MGMYDARCMLTGLPLTANAPATAVLLTGVDDGYRPAALGLQGIYNCYGTTDEVREDVNAGDVVELRAFVEEVDRPAAVLAALMATEIKQAVATDKDGTITA